MYKCVMAKIKETDTLYVAFSDGLCFLEVFFVCFVLFFLGGGFMGQT